jgi:hypothetical protein
MRKSSAAIDRQTLAFASILVMDISCVVLSTCLIAKRCYGQ